MLTLIIRVRYAELTGKTLRRFQSAKQAQFLVESSIPFAQTGNGKKKWELFNLILMIIHT